MPRQDNGAHHGIHQRGQVGPLSAGDSALSTEMGFRGVVNSDSNRAYRRSLFSAATLQDVCRACSDPYRGWGSDSLLQFGARSAGLRRTARGRSTCNLTSGKRC